MASRSSKTKTSPKGSIKASKLTLEEELALIPTSRRQTLVAQQELEQEFASNKGPRANLKPSPSPAPSSAPLSLLSDQALADLKNASLTYPAPTSPNPASYPSHHSLAALKKPYYMNMEMKPEDIEDLIPAAYNILQTAYPLADLALDLETTLRGTQCDLQYRFNQLFKPEPPVEPVQPPLQPSPLIPWASQVKQKVLNALDKELKSRPAKDDPAAIKNVDVNSGDTIVLAPGNYHIESGATLFANTNPLQTLADSGPLVPASYNITRSSLGATTGSSGGISGTSSAPEPWNTSPYDPLINISSGGTAPLTGGIPSVLVDDSGNTVAWPNIITTPAIPLQDGTFHFDSRQAEGLVTEPGLEDLLHALPQLTKLAETLVKLLPTLQDTQATLAALAKKQQLSRELDHLIGGTPLPVQPPTQPLEVQLPSQQPVETTPANFGLSQDQVDRFRAYEEVTKLKDILNVPDGLDYSTPLLLHYLDKL